MISDYLTMEGLSDTESSLYRSENYPDSHREGNWDTNSGPQGPAATRPSAWQFSPLNSSPLPLVFPSLSFLSKGLSCHLHCSIDGKGGLSELTPSTVCSLRFGLEITWNSSLPPTPPPATHPPLSSQLLSEPCEDCAEAASLFLICPDMCKPEQASGNIAILSDTGIRGSGLLGGWVLGGRHRSAYNLSGSPVVPKALLRQSPGPQVTEWELRMATGMMLCLYFLGPVGI